MSEQATNLTITVKDDELHTFLNNPAGTIDRAGYSELLARYLKTPLVTLRQKGKLVVTAIQRGRHEHLAVLVSSGVDIVCESDTVVHNGSVYSLGVIFTAEVAKIVLEKMLDLTDIKFNLVKKHYASRPGDMTNFGSLYSDELTHANLTRLFTRLGSLPATGIPLKLAMMCGRQDLFHPSNKDMVITAIEMQDMDDNTAAVKNERDTLKAELESVKNERDTFKKELDSVREVLNVTHNALTATNDTLISTKSVLSMARQDLKASLNETSELKQSLERDLRNANESIAELRALIVRSSP